MVEHAPPNYRCPFCRLVRGDETIYNSTGDIVCQDDEVMAFISPKWWPNNPGNLIIIPIRHVENIYTIPDELLSHLMVVSKRLAGAVKAVYGCDGTSFRQHNEPGGDQELLHYHLHLFPRYFGDDLYRKTDEHRFANADERQVYAQRLRSFLEHAAT
ncbi:MAG: HIT family protein [Chloroflexia bacterium]|nr:HIT family protein [Chloroflexia bacterium]